MDIMEHYSIITWSKEKKNNKKKLFETTAEEIRTATEKIDNGKSTREQKKNRILNI